MTLSLRARACLFLLAVVLASSPAMAAGGRPFQIEEVGIASALWELVGFFVPGLAEARGAMDPGRSPRSATAPSGSIMDPDGLTAGACQGDSGSIMDPDGCQTTRSQTAGSGSDSGSIMDPNG